MESLPLVSILINNYNYDRFIAQAIDSALSQTYSRIEVIVVDDGSTDHSRDIITSYGDRIIPVLKPNGGQASAFNVGVEHSQGDLLFFLDSDDCFLPDKVEKIAALFEKLTPKNTNITICHGREIIDEKGQHREFERINSSCEWREISKNKRSKTINGQTLTQISNADEVYRYAKKYRYIPFLGAPTSGVAMTRTLAEQIFPLTCENIKVRADDFLVKAASLLGDIYFLEEPFIQYRVHGTNNWYGSKKAEPKDFLDAVDQFLNYKLKILENSLFYLILTLHML